jgi:hypothetical protein
LPQTVKHKLTKSSPISLGRYGKDPFFTPAPAGYPDKHEDPSQNEGAVPATGCMPSYREYGENTSSSSLPTCMDSSMFLTQAIDAGLGIMTPSSAGSPKRIMVELKTDTTVDIIR